MQNQPIETTSPESSESAQHTHDQQNTIEHLIDITAQLADIFAKENEFLSSSKASQMGPLQDEKARLANSYAKAIREVAANRHLIENTNGELLSNLRDITARFNSLASRQAALLEGATRVSEGIVGSVLKEAQKTDGANGSALSTYSQKATPNANQHPVVISVNECA